jgi:hypothetical protein
VTGGEYACGWGRGWERAADADAQHEWDGWGEEDGWRTVVAEYLSAFERALAEAAVKTKAIMAVS